MTVTSVLEASQPVTSLYREVSAGDQDMLLVHPSAPLQRKGKGA